MTYSRPAVCIIIIILGYSTFSFAKRSNNFYQGYNICPTPNKLDSVGSIIAIDENKQVYRISSINVVSTPTIVFVPTYTNTRNMKWGVIAKFLGDKTNNITAGINFNGKSKLIKKISYDTTRIFTQPILDIDTKIKEKEKEINTFVRENSNKKLKFYLIYEAIDAKKVNYSIDRQLADTLGVDVNFKKIVTVNPNLQWDKVKSPNTLVFYSNNPVIVLYKTWELQTVSNLTGGNISLTLSKNGQDVVGDNQMLYE